jgi:hypothetical protein
MSRGVFFPLPFFFGLICFLLLVACLLACLLASWAQRTAQQLEVALFLMPAVHIHKFLKSLPLAMLDVVCCDGVIVCASGWLL